MPDRLASEVVQRPRIAFLAETQVGIGSVASTLRRLAVRSQVATVDWTDVTYHQANGWLERLPCPRGLTGTARGILQVRAALRREADVLVFLTHNPAVFHPYAVTHTPTLLWTDVTPSLLDAQADAYGHRRAASRVAAAVKRIAVTRLFHAAWRCAAWSEWARSSFVHEYGVPPERTLVVPPGIDLTRWRAPARPTRRGKVRVLFVGGDFRRKGGHLVVEAFRGLSGSCELDVVTRDPVDSLPGVRVHRGLRAGSPDLIALYRRADLFVLPTLADCHSIASLEAMAMGLPVLASRAGALPEIVEDGRSGWLVNADAPGVAAALRAAVADPERLRRAGERGLAIVRDRFDARRTMAALLDAALSALPRRAGS